MGLFEWIGLFTNAANKMKAMVCIPGRIREGYTEEEYANWKHENAECYNPKDATYKCQRNQQALARIDPTSNNVKIEASFSISRSRELLIVKKPAPAI